MKFNTLGVWAMRITLVIGAIVGGCLGKDDVCGGCLVALVLSFVLLEG